MSMAPTLSVNVTGDYRVSSRAEGPETWMRSIEMFVAYEKSTGSMVKDWIGITVVYEPI